MNIVFNKPSITNVEKGFINESLENLKLCGDGKYTKLLYEKFDKELNIKNILMTTSCTHALEMAAILADIKEGDEVIVPSYTFVSTINAFVLRGAIPVFVDVEKDTMNMDVNLIEEKITSKTKAICPVHYAGVVCDMDRIMEIANKYKLVVIEDAAQAVGSFYKGKAAGTIGDYGCFSFHETKNYTMGEGGALICKDISKYREAEIIREKGTDRSNFFRGEVDKYTWQSVGSSYLPSDVLCAMLYGQMERFNDIMNKRMEVWNYYNGALENLEKEGLLIRPYIPEYSTHNAHMYYIIVENNETRDRVIRELKRLGINTTFHYIPLHTCPAGVKYCNEEVTLPISEEYSGRLIRLPLYYDLSIDEVKYIIDSLKKVISWEK